MTHRHVDDGIECVEIGETVCLSPVSDGFFIHFDPSEHGFRQIGHVTVGPGAWTQTGTLAGGDLTLRPSIAIRMPVDGKSIELLHGFVTDGKWVPA